MPAKVTTPAAASRRKAAGLSARMFLALEDLARRNIAAVECPTPTLRTLAALEARGLVRFIPSGEWHITSAGEALVLRGRYV